MTGVLSELASQLIKEDPALADEVGRQLVANGSPDISTWLGFDDFRRLMQRRDRVDRRYGFPLLLANRNPERVRADHFMLKLRLPFHTDPHMAFVSLANRFIEINHEIRRYGWQITRSGGTPKDSYWLEAME